MPLAGSQFQQLQQALLGAFPTYSALAQMVRFGLNENLDAVAGTGKLADVVFQLIQWAEANGITEELIAAAYHQNSTNPTLKAYVERFHNSLAHSTPTDPNTRLEPEKKHSEATQNHPHLVAEDCELKIRCKFWPEVQEKVLNRLHSLPTCYIDGKEYLLKWGEFSTIPIKAGKAHEFRVGTSPALMASATTRKLAPGEMDCFEFRVGFWGASMVHVEDSSVLGNVSTSADVSPIISHQENIVPANQIDFVIITALEVERRAVCAAFGLTDDQRERRDSRVYWRGRLPLKNGEYYEIAVAQSPDMANVDAALLTSDALHHWKPGAALMVGIAAAASDEQHLGDIIVGSDVYYYERGKVKPEGVKPEPKMYPAEATLWNNVNALPDWTAEILAVRPDGTANRPVVRKGVIASGEKVIANEVARGHIASGHRKIIAIEMEGYGFSAAVWQSFQQVRHLVIRGICDLADASKNDEWHPYAAAAAASFAKHFLLDRPLEPKNEAEDLVRYRIILDGDPDSLNKSGYEQLLLKLHQLTHDHGISIHEVRRGSIIIELDGSKESFKVINALFNSGSLQELCGLPIRAVDLDETQSIQNNCVDSKGMPASSVPSSTFHPIEMFYSYSHKDEKLRAKLETHLALLKRQGVIASWHDRKIGAGQEWANQIDDHLNNAQIILLLVSADFLASDYCYDVELKRAMERHKAGEAHVVPIILRPCDWHSSPFGQLQALPKDAKPIADWSRQDNAFLDVARGIRRAVEDLHLNPS